MQWSAAVAVMRSCVQLVIAIALLSLTGSVTSPIDRCRAGTLLATRFVPLHALIRSSQSLSTWLVKVRP